MFQPGHTFGETDLDLILADPDDCDLGETVAVLAYARHGGPVGKCIRALAQLPTSSPCYAMDIMRLCAVPYDSDKLTLLRHYASELKDEPGIDSSPGLLVEMAYAMSFAPDLAPEHVEDEYKEVDNIKVELDAGDGPRELHVLPHCSHPPRSFR